MRILQVHTSYRQAGGEDAVVRDEAALLRAAGHDVVTYHVENPQAPLPTAAALAGSVWNPVAAGALGSAARHARADVAHVHNTWYALSPAVFRALRRAGVPVVATLHNYRLLCTNGLLYRDGRPCQDCVGTHAWRGVAHRCYRGSAPQSALVAGMLSVSRALGVWERDVDLFLALTDFARQRFVEGGLPAAKLAVKPNTVPDPGGRLTAPADSRTVLYVGRLTEEKGIETLVRAWSAAQLDGLELAVVGDGPLRPALERHSPPGVRIVGPKDPAEVARLMRGARALAFPSRWYETFGLVAVEAMAAGLPVLASDLGSGRELLGHDPTWLVPAGDVDAWAGALRSLEDRDALDRAGSAGRQRWERDFSPTAGLRALEGAYARAIAQHGA